MFHPLQPFAAEVTHVDLPRLHDRAVLDALRDGMDAHGVLVFRDQPLTDAEQLDFARRFDGVLHTKTGSAAIGKAIPGLEALTEISNVDELGDIRRADDRRRMYSLANLLWHTDGSFQDPPGRYSLLSTRAITEQGPDTEYADMRAAYDALDEPMKRRLDGLHVHHSIAYSRQTLGFEFSTEELARLEGAVHPLVRTNPRSGRRSLYLASHATRIIEMLVPEGRILLRDLIDHATQRQFVHVHRWRSGDLVIWDNLATMHRGRPYDDANVRRELRRVTTLDMA